MEEHYHTDDNFENFEGIQQMLAALKEKGVDTEEVERLAQALNEVFDGTPAEIEFRVIGMIHQSSGKGMVARIFLQITPSVMVRLRHEYERHHQQHQEDAFARFMHEHWRTIAGQEN